MKKHIKYILISAAILFNASGNAQTINWAGLNENRHIVNANVAVDNGTTYGIGYGYHFKTNLFPIVANVEYSAPTGKNAFDDFKTKIGVEISWIKFHNFQFSTKIQGLFRRYENDYVRLLNFGSDMSGIIGYYHSRWFAAAEVGFDKAIVTNFKHSNTYREQYPGVVDGWYEPATGGLFYYGIQGGISFSKNDIYLRAGKSITQDFKTDPLVPFYFQVGCNFRF